MNSYSVEFHEGFDEIMKSSGCEIKKTPVRSPNLQAHVERIVQTLKHEDLNDFVVVSEKNLNHIFREAQDWHNNERGHSARENLPPGRSEQIWVKRVSRQRRGCHQDCCSYSEDMKRRGWKRRCSNSFLRKCDGIRHLISFRDAGEICDGGKR